MVRSAERVGQRGDSFPTKFVFNKAREKQRRMSESVYLIREQGSGEPRGLPSPLIELTRDQKDVERPGSLSPNDACEVAVIYNRV